MTHSIFVSPSHPTDRGTDEHMARGTDHEDLASLGMSLGVTFAASVADIGAEDEFIVRAGGKTWRATPALSCLVEPCMGDEVLCCLLDDRDQPMCYVLAVLSRSNRGPIRLSVAGDLQLQSRSGSVEVQAQGGVDMKSRCFSVEAQTMHLRADDVSLVTRALTIVAETCTKTFNRLTMVGEQLSTVFSRELHHAQSHVRTVDGVDKLSAQVVDCEATQMLHLRGENVLTNGNRLVKVQGSQIHLG